MRRFKYLLLIFSFVSIISCTQETIAGFGNKSELIRWYNYQLPDYIELNGCNPSCMYELLISDSEDLIYWKINHNFREDVVRKGMEEEDFKKQVEFILKKIRE